MKTESQAIDSRMSARVGWAPVLALALSVLFGSVPAATAQTVEPIMLTGGAQKGAGGGYHITGAVEPMCPNNPITGEYSLSTGTRSLEEEPFAAETPPVLQAKLFGTELVVFWPLAAQGFVLQRASRLGPGTDWIDVPAPYQTDGAQLQAIFNLPDRPQFFRLHRR